MEAFDASVVHQRAVQLLQERQQSGAAEVLVACTLSIEADASGSVVALALQPSPTREAVMRPAPGTLGAPGAPGVAATARYLDATTLVRADIAAALRDALPADTWIESLVLLDSQQVDGGSHTAPAPVPTSSRGATSPEDMHAHNQATGFQTRREWHGLRFRSESELRVAQALERAGVLFLPNCKARLGAAGGRTTREPDFLICSHGNWGILEVDGEPYHPAERTATEHERDRVLKQHGVRVVEHFDAARCFATPDVVVREFLALLDNV